MQSNSYFLCFYFLFLFTKTILKFENFFHQGSHYFKTPIKIEVARASQTAIKAIEKAGGNITCRYYNRLALRATIKPEKFWKIPKFAAPVKAKDIEWYSNYKNRGYLSKKLAGLPVTQANAQMAARAI